MKFNSFIAIVAFYVCNALNAGHTMYIGSYNSLDDLAHEPKPTHHVAAPGISAVHIADDGTMTMMHEQAQLNPAFILIHPNKRTLYAISESINDDNKGLVSTYSIEDDMSLTFITSMMPSGKSTCYMALNEDNSMAVITSYWDSRVDVMSVSPTGSLRPIALSIVQSCQKNARQVTDKYDHWQHRQVGAHAHAAHFLSKRTLFIPDLGDNAVYQYDISTTDDKPKLKCTASIPFPPGAGPRHMAFHPHLDVAYVSNELGNTVTVGRLKESASAMDQRFILQQNISTLPSDFTGINYVSEVSLSPDGKFLYVSNRGHDSIAIYAIHGVTGELSIIDTTRTGGHYPRHFAISPEGNLLVVANQNTNTLNAFARDIKTGRLTDLGKSLSVGMPNFVRFY